jgi:hypothetical protein
VTHASRWSVAIIDAIERKFEQDLAELNAEFAKVRLTMLSKVEL